MSEKIIENSDDEIPNDSSTPIFDSSNKAKKSLLLSNIESKGSKYCESNDDYYKSKNDKNYSSLETIKNLCDYPKFGYYTVFFLVLYEAIMLPLMANMTFMVYGGFTPKIKSCDNENFENLTSTEICNVIDKVIIEKNCTPVLESQFHSISYEFNYYCSNAKTVKNSISIQMFGVLFGAVIFGQLSDLYGRRKIMLICVIGMTIVDFLSSNSTSLMQFTCLQFIVLLFTGGSSTISVVYLMETIPKSYRVFVTLAISYSPNYIILAAIAYVANDWRTLLRYISLINIPTFIMLYLAYESPRYLIQSGSLNKAKEIYEKIEKINKTITPERQLILDDLIQREYLLLEQKKKNKKYYLYHLFYTWKMTSYSIILSFSLFCTAMITYSLIFNMEKLSGSVYMNNVLLGIIRYGFNIGFAFLDYKFHKIGRKTIHRWVIFYIILTLSIVFFIKQFDLQNYSLLTNLCILSATAMCSQLFMVALIVTSELFPTPVRNIAGSFQQIWTRFGVIVAPHFFYITNITPSTPYLFMVIFMTINVLLFFFLIPESKGQSMTDHMPSKTERIFIKKSKKENQI